MRRDQFQKGKTERKKEGREEERKEGKILLSEGKCEARGWQEIRA